MTLRDRPLEEVLAGFEAGDRRSLARALSWLEDADPRGREVLAASWPRTGRARVIGVTGSPGAGKSTLVDHLAVAIADASQAVAVLAVDPSSAFSGGALLGDRIRMSAAAQREAVFVRSMATRGELGGLARATADAVDLLDAFGFDVILVETVGVGQDEVEVMEVAHVNLLVLVPFMGDDVQALKAGVMEIGDVFVINKADREGADRLEAELKATLQLREEGVDDVPILQTVATRGEGVKEVLAAAQAVLAKRLATDVTARWRVGRARRRVESVVQADLFRAFLERGGRERLARAAEAVAARESDPYTAGAAALAVGPRLEHLGIAVSDVAAALSFWQGALGLEVSHEEAVPSEGVRVTMLPVGDARVELLAAVSDESPVKAFLDKRGAGIHHVCLEVTDIRAAVDRLRAAGARVIGESPRRGAEGRLVAFVHPSSAQGVLVELSQRAGRSP